MEEYFVACFRSNRSSCNNRSSCAPVGNIILEFFLSCNIERIFNLRKHNQDNNHISKACGFIFFSDGSYLSQTLLDFPQIRLILKTRGPASPYFRVGDTRPTNFGGAPHTTAYFNLCLGKDLWGPMKPNT